MGQGAAARATASRDDIGRDSARTAPLQRARVMSSDFFPAGFLFLLTHFANLLTAPGTVPV